MKRDLKKNQSLPFSKKKNKRNEKKKKVKNIHKTFPYSQKKKIYISQS